MVIKSNIVTELLVEFQVLTPTMSCSLTASMTWHNTMEIIGMSKAQKGVYISDGYLHSLFYFFFLLCFLGYEVFHTSLSFHDGIKIFVAQLCISKTEHAVTKQSHMPEASVAI